jgi:hypothetical protein
MKKSLKMATVAVVALLALGAVAFVYASSLNGFNANNTDEQNQVHTQNMRSFFMMDNVTLPDNVTMPCLMRRGPQMHTNGLQLGRNFLENATISTVQGTVVSEYKDMLILNTDAGQVRVLLPKEWSVNNDTISRGELFNGTFASSGQNVTIKVLESDVFSNASFSINVMIGYEAINATSTHAYAVLPFNITPHS